MKFRECIIHNVSLLKVPAYKCSHTYIEPIFLMGIKWGVHESTYNCDAGQFTTAVA